MGISEVTASQGCGQVRLVIHKPEQCWILFSLFGLLSQGGLSGNFVLILERLQFLAALELSCLPPSLAFPSILGLQVVSPADPAPSLL